MTDIRNAEYWHNWAMRALLILGAAHLLAGVVFFFAYNWQDLTPFAKFALLEGAIVVTFAAALYVGVEQRVGQGLLAAASAFTGVLLAVIGQVYQTGADAWELFAAWTVLILPWTLAAKNSVQWMLWFLILLCALGLYGEQVLVALGRLNHYQLLAAVGVLPTVALLIREFAIGAGVHWLENSWARRTLVFASLATLFVPAVSYVFDDDKALPCFIAFVATILLLAFVYRLLRPHFSIVAIVAGFTTLLAMALGARGIHEIVGFNDEAASLIFSLLVLVGWCVLLTGGVVRFLNAMHAQMEGGDD